MRSYILQHYDAIDTNHDGMIVDAEMAVALEDVSLEAGARQVLERMRIDQSLAGHAIGSYPVNTWVWITTGTNGSGYMSPIVSIEYIYGISRADLDLSPQRVLERWRYW